ncbi:nitrile hydratase subunit beta [Rhodobaculum claviforme]|uniref:Nitrile hydratase subunit beta n=1 Tax=Rhodobaculum claviforme TaxID=1549854 RepID=A0A934WIN9_9RHOB|nr:nitrile hydratase subunit beta [Rhodobaculum claviforme]MBK5926773.1 nitrile hydratase subunit beta [Rhodobaculum claviforme]
MNGPHDLGGQMGFGPVIPEPEAEPEAVGAPFHAAWEGRALGLTLCAGALGHWSIDESRHARESLPPAVYHSSSYFEIWIRALEALLLRHALLSAAELASGDAAPSAAHPRKLAAAAVAATLARGGPSERPIDRPARFAPGDRVRARNMHPRGHTRLPRYVRGRVGTVEADHGGHVLPDTNAHGRGESPERLYTVVFDGAEVWGADAEPGLSISVDAWESYLEPA